MLNWYPKNHFINILQPVNFVDIIDEGVSVQLAAPPVDGKANSELVAYLAKVLGVRKSNVAVEKVRRKVFPGFNPSSFYVV